MNQENIPSWVEYPDLPPGRQLFIKSAIINHGAVIYGNWNGDDRFEGGTYQGNYEYMRRRYAVIDVYEDLIILSLGSVAAMTSSDSDDPYEIHKKYLAGEWSKGPTMELDPALNDLELVLGWSGEPWFRNEGL